MPASLWLSLIIDYLPEALQSLNRCGSYTHIRATLFVNIALV